MQADIEGNIMDMKLEGTMADIFSTLDPKMYRKHVRNEHRKLALYVHLKKAFYGILHASLLVWKKLAKLLESWGFKVNPYDRCVVNKIINEKKCRVIWHVDDLKILYVDYGVNPTIIDKLTEEFWKHGDLTIHRGSIHDYSGITLDYSKKGKIKAQILDYIYNILKDLPDR